MAFACSDPRGTIQKSLRTASLEVARLKRDELEKADDLYWSGVADGEQAATASQAHEAARTRALGLGFRYLTADRLAQEASLEELLARIEKVKETGGQEAPA
ncbi:MAG: integrase, partial [Pseudomonadota bacterium]